MGIDDKVLIELLTLNLALFSVMLFMAAILCVNLLIPIVIWVSFQKRLVTPINSRSSHRSITPPFGGVAFYIIIVVFISCIQMILNDGTGYTIIAAISILFMIGLKDDLVHSTARIKLLAQLFAGMFIVGTEKFRIATQLDTFGLGQILLLLLSISLLILIINAYNLIDGIDGLAAMTGMISCAVFAFLFYHNGDQFFFLLAIITLGILTAFLRFNLSSKSRKIFMGDCGSLSVGLILALCTIRFLAMLPNAKAAYQLSIEHKLVVVSAILFVPLLDTSRIILIRLVERQNLFKADKNHIHHVLINKGFSHAKASLLLSGIHCFVVIVVVAIAGQTGIILLGAIAASMYGAAGLLFSKKARIRSLYTSS